MANSQTPATTDTISRPIGSTVPSSCLLPNRTTARPPAMNPPAVQARPKTTDVHSIETHGVTACRRARANIQSGSESTSTRSPMLNTGP